MITLILLLELRKVYPKREIPKTAAPTGYPFIRYNQ